MDQTSNMRPPSVVLMVVVTALQQQPLYKNQITWHAKIAYIDRYNLIELGPSRLKYVKISVHSSKHYGPPSDSI